MSARLQTVADWLDFTRVCGYDAARMAAACRVTLRTLELFFHNRIGGTPTLWTMDVRCLDAEALLRSGVMTRVVALDLGFADPAHLCHEIRKRYGTAPQDLFALPSPSTHERKVLLMLQKFRLSPRISPESNHRPWTSYAVR